VLRIQLQIFFILKLRHDLRVMDDRSDDQLREKRDKQQIVDDVVLFRLAAVCIHKECDQLEGEK